MTINDHLTTTFFNKPIKRKFTKKKDVMMGRYIEERIWNAKHDIHKKRTPQTQ